MREGSTHVGDEIGTADRRDRIHLYEVGAKLGRLQHLRRRHRSGHRHHVARAADLEHLGDQGGADEEARAREHGILGLRTGEDGSCADDRALLCERVVGRELRDELVRVGHRERDLHQADAGLGHRSCRALSDLGRGGPDDRDEPVFAEDPDEVTAQR